MIRILLISLIALIIQISTAFSTEPSCITDSCRDKYEISTDLSNYGYWSLFMLWPPRILAQGFIEKRKSFQIQDMQIYQPLDSVYSHFGKPLCESFSPNTEHTGLATRSIYYRGIRFEGTVYSDTQSPYIESIYTWRENLTTPDGLHCGMTISDVKKVITTLTWKECDDSGIVRLSCREGGPLLELVFVDGIMITLILWSGQG